jgi:hypothetical protein
VSDVLLLDVLPSAMLHRRSSTNVQRCRGCRFWINRSLHHALDFKIFAHHTFGN